MSFVCYGLPSPLVLGLAADLLLQLLLLSVLALPLGLRRLRRSVDGRVPRRRTRFFLAAVVVVLASLPGVLGGAEITTPSEAAPCESLADAERLGLAPGAIVVDPRPPLSFASYHLAGSCRRRLAELPAVAAARPGATLYVVDDTEFPAERLEVFREQGIDAMPLPGGLQAFYKPGGHAFGFSDPPLDVVNADGPVVMQLGPLWFMGEQSPVAPLRQRPESAARGDVTLVDVRDHGGDLPAYEAYADRLPEGPVLVLCDDPPSCLAADALGASAPRVRGKIRSLRSAESLRSGDAFGDGATAIALLAFFLSVLFVTHRFPRWASWCVPAGAATFAFAAPRVFSGDAFFYAIDVRGLSPLFVVLVLVWLRRHESSAGRTRGRVRVVVLLSIVAVAASELFGQGSGGLHSISVAAFAAGLVALVIHDGWASRRTLHPLRFADARAGGKAARLAEVIARGGAVPAGVVVHDGYEGELPSAVRRSIGDGPYVVRSSAKGEDAMGAATAGRYESVRDVAPAQLVAAVQKVRGAYEFGAVLVQRQVSGRLAGVTEDAPLGLFRVEAAEAQSDALLQGEGATHSGVGSAVGEWANVDVPVGRFVRVHDRVRNDAAVQSEWVLDDSELWVVQVRDVEESSPQRPEAAAMITALRKAWVRKDDRVVLTNAALADYDGACNATVDLLARLLGAGTWRDAAQRLLGVTLPAPAPSLVRLGGRLFANQVPSRPVKSALSLPVRRVRLWWLRRRRKRALGRIHAALSLAARPGETLDSAAPVAIALGLLTTLTDSEPGLAGDPFLSAIARGETPEVPGRASPDLALRLSRDGQAPMPAVPPLQGDFVSDLAELRGCARQLLAHHMAPYRQKPGLVLDAAPIETMPMTMTLPQLERYALDGVSGFGDGEECGVWIGEAVPGEYRVGEDLVLLDVPTPEAMAAADPATLVVAKRGSRLCHGALVARERGVRALFGVGEVTWENGDIVHIESNGQVHFGDEGRTEPDPPTLA